MRSSHHRLSRYGPLVVWATLIFIGSSSALSGTNTSVVLRPLLWLFPLVNSAYVVVVRYRAHRPLLKGDRSHLYDALRARYGLTRTLTVCWVVAALGSLFAALLARVI